MQEGLTIQANGRWQQIKLLRAEWAHPRTVAGLYSRVLYITNLTPVSHTLTDVRLYFYLPVQVSWTLVFINLSWASNVYPTYSPPVTTPVFVSP